MPAASKSTGFRGGASARVETAATAVRPGASGVPTPRKNRYPATQIQLVCSSCGGYGCTACSGSLSCSSFPEGQPCVSQGDAQRAVRRRVHGSKHEKDRHQRGIDRQLYEIHWTQRKHERGIEIPAVRCEIGEKRQEICNCRETTQPFEGRQKQLPIIPLSLACFRDPRARQHRNRHAENTHHPERDRKQEPCPMNRHVDALQHHVRNAGEKRSQSTDQKKNARDSPDRASGHEPDSNSGSEFEHAWGMGAGLPGGIVRVPHVSQKPSRSEPTKCQALIR